MRALSQQPDRIRAERQNLPATQAKIAAIGLIKALGKGERVGLPCDRRDPFAHRSQQNIPVAQPLQIGIPCEIFHQLFDRDMVAPPEGNRIQCLSQERRGELGNHLPVVPQLLRRSGRERIRSAQSRLLPFQRCVRTGLRRH